VNVAPPPFTSPHFPALHCTALMHCAASALTDSAVLCCALVRAATLPDDYPPLPAAGLKLYSPPNPTQGGIDTAGAGLLAKEPEVSRRPSVHVRRLRPRALLH
jgi:hypothetical protein